MIFCLSAEVPPSLHGCNIEPTSSRVKSRVSTYFMWYFIDDTLVLKFSTRDTLFRLYRSIYTHGVGIFVTGAGGFIGGHLVERLVELNAGQIVAMDNFHRPCIGDAPDFFHGVKFLQADVRDHSALLEGMRGTKVVFHLAA